MNRGAAEHQEQDGGTADGPTPQDPPAPAPVGDAPQPGAGWRLLFRGLLILALPIMAEHLLHIMVGLTDTWLANNLISTTGLAGDQLEAARAENATAAAAIGSATYLLWFLGLMTGAVGAGSTALIARATGAGDRETANRAVGQSLLLAFGFGILLACLFYFGAGWISSIFQLPAEAEPYMSQYLRILAIGVPLAMCTFIANACLRGAGDTITPAIAMIVLDIANIILSFGLCYGIGPLPQMGFAGIAWGTSIAYGGGSLVVLASLVFGIGRSHLLLTPARLRPDPETTRRILRIGIPSGGEGLIHWGANFVVVAVVNTLGAVPAAAHNIAIRIESLSYMTGFAVATAAATMVGQSLGMGDPVRARRCGYLGFALGGGLMILAGFLFILIPGQLARLMNDGPAVSTMTADILFIAGFAQIGFAAMMIFGGALRGAGDTLSVMILNLSSSLTVRMLGAVIAVKVLGWGLTGVWLVLCLDLMIRGALLWWRFHGGRWTSVKV